MNTTHPLERIFHYQGRPFRTLQAEGDDAWFVAADVCKALGLSQVIPALRQTGSYQMEPAAAEFSTLPRFTRRDLLSLAISTEDECDELRQKNAALLPKAAAYERLADTTDTFSLGETAKLLGIPAQGRNKLIQFLRSDGVLMTNNVARQRFIDRDYFHIVQQEYIAPDGTPHVRAVTRVYTSGIEFIRQRMENFVRRQLLRSSKY